MNADSGSTNLGRLVLNVLLSFAQFEREIISERTRDKIAATRRKGKWAGGHPILGYDIDPNGYKLVVNPKEAERVRAIFALYLEHGSLLPVVEELGRRGWANKRWTTRRGPERGGKPFTRTSLYHLLTNVAYAGKVRYKQEVHDGAVAPFCHARHELLDQDVGCAQVQVHVLVEERVVSVGGRAESVDARVVDQDVDRTRVVGQPAHLLGLR